jgi:acyl transferase domain-containing protein/NAD(P)-dependent dehydrogenase (short-subunit alcohol dehydrogenase family)
MVIVGGIDTVQGPFGYLCFAQTQALSPRGKCSTFDANGDGICISEGLATVCLKRLEDAERDGDRIYAVIKGVGGSSDGRAKSMTAPHPDGQIRALERAYTKAGYSPATVGLFEAHGTGTVAGDNAELETVTRLMANAGAQPKTSVIGSVKTMIGHTKASAGVAGLIKSALSLHHRVLPPHCNVETPVDKVGSNDSPLYLLKDPQPWIADADKPRRASVSAFGFGGTNFHIAMQEYDGEYLPQVRPAVRETWPAELLVWAANDNDALVTNIQETAALFAQQANPCMRDIAYTLATTSNGTLRAAMVATDGANAQQLIGHLVAHIQDSGKPLPPGAYFNRAPLAEEGGVALLFAGQGSQYPNMLRDVALEFDDIANVLERAESLVGDDIESASGMRLSRMIYTPGLYSDADEKAAAAALTRTEVTQPALAVIEAGLWGLLQRCGVKPDMAAGHSYGEFAALYAAGVISLDELIKVSAARGRFVAAAGVGDADLGGMVAVRSERERVEQVAKAFDDLTVANHNSSSQTILSGSKASVRAVAEKFSAVDIDATVLPVGAAFHSSFVAAARDQLADYIASMEMQPPAFPVYSNTTAKPHANKVAGIRKTLSAHMVSPVEFVAEIEAMYAAGARVFVGLGPKNVQASLVDQILGEREHKVVRIDDHEGGLKGLLNGLGMMFAEGMALNFDPIYERRNCQTIKLADPASATREVPPPKHAWILNGGSARALNEELRAPMTLEEAQALKAKRAVPVASSIPVQPPPVAAAESPAPAPVQRQPKRRLKPTRRIRKETAMTDNYPPSVGVSGDGQSYAPEGEREALLVAYQETMQQFLESQERIMLAYLTGSAPAQSGARPAALAVPRARQAVPRPPMVPPPVAAAPVAAPAAPAPAPAAPPPPVVATPPPAPAPAPVAAPAAAATVDAASITSMLLEIVEDRTGYPQDMLGLDQNMEADLGIDSIKRVEIVGAMIKALPSGYVNGEASEGLNAKKTLQEMIDYLAAAGTGKEAATAPFNHTEVEAVDSNCAPLPRFIIQAQTESADAIPLDPFDKGLYIIVDEGYGVGAAIQASVTSAGATVVMIDAKPAANAAQLQRLLDAARAEHGPVRGVFHLAALAAERYDSDAQLSAWQTSVTLNDKSLYQLIQMLADDLQSGGRVVAATAQGGSFAREGAQPGLVACGGSTGLLKSVHEEWPALQVKAVDLDPALSGLANAEILCNEWRLPGGRIEVGYPAGQRTVFRSVEAPMSATNVSPEHTPDSDWVVLATGGARGITAEVLVGLASAGVQLVLVGRTEEPGAEDPAMVGLTSEAELQGYLLQRAKAEGRSLKPIEVKQQIAAILRDREIAGNLADFRAAGARVDYRVADVRNEEGIKALLDDIYKQYGRLDGLVHGAGIIEDKALINKTMESASRVIDTKVDSTFVLSKYLRSHNLKFVVFFTSVAGRYGNTGQVDYATANEIVNRLALQLYWQWDEKVTVSAINWGPWAPTRYGKGMVSPETERKFAAMGVALVYPEPGRDLFMHSVTRAPSANVEVIAGLGPWEQRECERGEFRAGAMPRSATGASVSSVYPLLANTEQSAGPRGEIILHRTISVANDDYLSEHLLDDVPVLPAAGALELIAEAASSAWPGWVVSEISELRVLSGIQLKQNAVDIEIVALASSHGDASGFDASMTLRPAGGKGAAYYKATAHLASEIPESTPYQSTLQPGPASVDVAHAYREWLFHGPRFQTMRGFDGLDKRGALADIQPTSAASWLPNVQAEHDWLFDPGVIDSGPQMAIVWAHVMRDASALPSRFGRVRRFGTGPLGKCKMHFLLYPDQDDSTVKADVAFVDQQGHLRLFMEEMECSSSPALVRLGGGWKGEISV